MGPAEVRAITTHCHPHELSTEGYNSMQKRNILTESKDDDTIHVEEPQHRSW